MDCADTIPGKRKSEHAKDGNIATGLKRSSWRPVCRNEKGSGFWDETATMQLQCLARHHANTEDYVKAELLYKHAFVIIMDSDHYGPWHPRIAEILQHLVKVELKQVKYCEPTEILTHLRQLQQFEYGEDSREATTTAATLATLYDKQERWQDAEALYKHVISVRERPKDGWRRQETLAVMQNLALSYRMQGGKNLGRAAAQYEKVLSRRDRILREKGKGSKRSRENNRELRAQLRTIVSRLIEIYAKMRQTERCREVYCKYSWCMKEERS